MVKPKYEMKISVFPSSWLKVMVADEISAQLWVCKYSNFSSADLKVGYVLYSKVSVQFERVSLSEALDEMSHDLLSLDHSDFVIKEIC